jgi:hypothetical protein
MCTNFPEFTNTTDYYVHNNISMTTKDYDEADDFLSLCDVPIFTDEDMELAMRLQQEEDNTHRYPKQHQV